MRTNGQSQVRLARVLCYRGRISEGEKAVDRIALVSSAVRPSLYPRPYIHGSGAGADGTAPSAMTWAGVGAVCVSSDIFTIFIYYLRCVENAENKSVVVCELQSPSG